MTARDDTSGHQDIRPIPAASFPEPDRHYHAATSREEAGFLFFVPDAVSNRSYSPVIAPLVGSVPIHTFFDSYFSATPSNTRLEWTNVPKHRTRLRDDKNDRQIQT